MPERIIIEMGRAVFEGELNDGPAARKFVETLPIELIMSRWGDEYYGNCGITVEPGETTKEAMEPGEIAIWPPAQSLCIFFGPTPLSTDENPRSASASVPIGRITGNFTNFKMMGHTVKARVRRAE